MKIAAFVLTATLISPAAFAQATPHSHDHAKPGAAASSAMAEGEVRKVDKEARKITLKHGEIKSLDMPPMTMVFVAKDGALLDNVKQGDKVRFRAEKIGGNYTVTALEVAQGSAALPVK